MKMKVALAAKVYLVLETESKNPNNSVITTQDFCNEIYGMAYMKSTKYQLEKAIKESIQRAKEIALANGTQVLTIMKPANKKSTKKTRVYGWKLQKPGDENYVKDESKAKYDNLLAKANSLVNFTEKAVTDKLLSEEEIEKLKLTDVKKLFNQ